MDVASPVNRICFRVISLIYPWYFLNRRKILLWVSVRVSPRDQSAQRENYISIEETDGGTVVILQAGFYEIFKRVLLMLDALLGPLFTLPFLFT